MEAKTRIKEFEQKFGTTTLHLAYHAALPVVLNAEFVHLLRINFFLDPPETLDYNAELDLLLSSFCHEIGDGLYEIDREIRDELLKGLIHTYKYEVRIAEIGELLRQYTHRNMPWSRRPALERAQELTALDALEHPKAIQWLEKAEHSSQLRAEVGRDWFVAMRLEIERKNQDNLLESEHNISLSKIWKTLNKAQLLIKGGTFEDQDRAINNLVSYLQESPDIILPSSIYPIILGVLNYYSNDILPHLNIHNDEQIWILEMYEEIRSRLKAQKKASVELESKFSQMFHQIKSRELQSVEDVVNLFIAIVNSPSEVKIDFSSIQAESILKNQFQKLQTSFTATQQISFFERLISKVLPNQLKESFGKIKELFWDQLNELSQIKTVLVNLTTGTGQIVRTDIGTSLKSSGSDEIVFENIVDERMIQSGSNAIQSARHFLQEHFPEFITNRSLKVRCRFFNPMFTYTDTSVGLLIGVKVIGDVLDMPINPHALICGEVDHSGNILPVSHIAERVSIAEEDSDIHQIYFPEGVRIKSKEANVITVRKFAEAIEHYYGQQQLRSLLHREDWRDVPEISAFFGRQEELAKLHQWIVQERCRIVEIFGIAGIGKTYLSLRLVRDIREEFDYVVWRSLLNAPQFDGLLIDLIKFFSNQQEMPLPDSAGGKIYRLLHHFKTHRCLLIFDNMEAILRGGEQAGQFREGYESYGELLKQLGDISHQSCVLIASREKPRQVISLEGTTKPVRLLELGGLDEVSGRKIFAKLGTFSGSEAEWRKLINFYYGNPLALELVARHIQEIYYGDIAEFLLEGGPIFSDLYVLLGWHFDRLSEQEKEVIYWLAINRMPISWRELEEDILSSNSKKELPLLLQSLQQRLPLERYGTDFTIQPVLVEYITKKLILDDLVFCLCSLHGNFCSVL